MSSGPLVTPSSAERVAGVLHVAPAEDLADIVDRHWIVAWDLRGEPPVVREVLPDPCVNLAIEPAGVLVHGVKAGRSLHRLEGAGMVVGTKFWPGGFSGYVDAPVSTLTGREVTATELWGPELEVSLAAARSSAERIEIVTAFLRARRPAPDPNRTLVRDVVEAIAAAGPGAKVADIAADFAVAPRTLQRLFAAHVGSTPKQVLQRFRHQQAVDRLEAGEHGLARLAAELGYFDQAHFTQDFGAMAGRTPAAYA